MRRPYRACPAARLATGSARSAKINYAERSVVRAPGHAFTLCATRGSRCFARAGMLATFVIMAARVRIRTSPQPGVPSSRTGAGGRARRRTGPPVRHAADRGRVPSGNSRASPAPEPARHTSRNRPRRPPRNLARPHDPVVVLIGWIGQVISGAWMMVAGAVGFAARAVGRGARDLEPHHRRDGLGLLTLGLAIVLAGGLWTRMDNAAGHAIRQAVTGGFGSLAFLAPVLVALLAWRFLRHPDRNQATRRAALGWVRAAARPDRPARDRQGRAAPVRRRAGDPPGGRVHRVRGRRPAGPRADPLGDRRCCSRCWPSSACCSSRAPRCTGSPNASPDCAGSSVTRSPERPTRTAWRSTRTTRRAPGCGAADRAARSPRTSGCARPWRAASASSRTTRRCWARARSAPSGAKAVTGPRPDGEAGLIEALGFGSAEDVGPAGRRRRPARRPRPPRSRPTPSPLSRPGRRRTARPSSSC